MFKLLSNILTVVNCRNNN